jgi:hypothetical protein
MAHLGQLLQHELAVTFAKDDGMVVLYTRLVCPDELRLDDLPHIEHPFLATSDIYGLPNDACYQVIRRMPHCIGGLRSLWAPIGYIRDRLVNAVEQGEIFLLKPWPFQPVVRRVDAASRSDKEWEYCGGKGHLFLRGAVQWLIYQLSKSTRGGYVPATATAATPFGSFNDGNSHHATDAVQCGATGGNPPRRVASTLCHWTRKRGGRRCRKVADVAGAT